MITYEKRLNFRCDVVDEPRYAIVRGLEQMFDEPLWVRRAVRSESYAGLEVDFNEQN